MDKKIVIKRFEDLMVEKKISSYQLREHTEISSIIYQWKKNSKRDSTRNPSLKSIEKICEYLGVSLSLFFAIDDKDRNVIKRRELFDAIDTLSEPQIDVLTDLVKLLKTQNSNEKQ